MSSVLRASVLAGLLALLSFAGACGGTSDPSTPPTPAATTSASVIPSPSAPAAPPQRSEPNAARAWQHLRTLAGDIGSRPATTDSERRAAEYIGEQLEAAGYEVSIEPFEVQATLRGSATLRLGGGSTVDALPLNGSAEGAVRAPLASAGLGRVAELEAAQVRGKVALLDRGEITFGEKVRNAEAAGAVAVIVVNNEPGPFRGDLGGVVGIPAVSVAQEAGPDLAQAASDGVAVELEVETDAVNGTSQNVVGRPSDKPCTAYLGAHYDSVAAGPGANDNGSGTSLLLELARSRRIDGVCVIAFGAEEVGLFGSEAFVRDHDMSGAIFMMNFDMVAKMTRPTFIGDDSLTAVAAQVASEHGVDARTVAAFGPGTSSDHASFQEAGVPVLMFYSGDDEFIHTAQDDLDNVSEEDLGKLLDIAAAVLDQLLAA